MLTRPEPATKVVRMKIASIPKLFDHSILRPDATRDAVVSFAETAVRLKTATLMLQPCNLRFAAEVLKGSGVLLASVIGFPHGNETPSMKEYQTSEVLRLGAQEIDMVMNIPAFKNNEKSLFFADIEGVVRAAQGFKVKVILENCFLTDEEKRRACQWIAQTGAHFVKTSTGFAAAGATVDDVRLMSRGRGRQMRSQSRRWRQDDCGSSGLLKSWGDTLRLNSFRPHHSSLSGMARRQTPRVR